jgi:adenosylmethionine---8-amino-7-oxononanoate aminotransferase
MQTSLKQTGMDERLQKDRDNIWHPFTPLQGAEDPLLITSASGIYLHTHDGRKIIDAVSSWWVNIHGHSNPYIAEALATQARKLEHVIFAGFTHEPAIRLSDNLKTILPANQQKIFFSDNGSTAVEVALKMAMQYWYNKGIEKKNIIAFQGAYHGDTFGSMSVGDRGIFTDPFSRYLFDVMFVDFPDEAQEDNAFEQFKSYVDSSNAGAFIFEPLIQGAAGMRVYRPQVLDRMIAYAQAHNVVCIADEVFTGFGRTGKMFASDYLEHKPDIMALSKGLTGGTMPLGVTTCSGQIVSAFETDDFLKTFFHGHSYTANPLACAAANASYELLTAQQCQQNIARIAQQQHNFMLRLQGHKNIKTIRSLGTLVALEIQTGAQTSYTSAARKKIYSYFLERDILLRPLGNVIYVLPPYVISTEELSHVHASIEAFLGTM